MSMHTGEISGDGSINVFHDGEIDGEEDVKVALLDLVECETGLGTPSVSAKDITTYLKDGRKGNPRADGAYQWGSDGNDSTLKPGLHYRRIDTVNSIRKIMEVAGEKFMEWEVGSENVEKLHEPCGKVLSRGQVVCVRKAGFQIADESWCSEMMLERSSASGITYPQKSRRHWVNVLSVKLKEVAGLVDQDISLKHLLGETVISNDIVREIIKDLQS